VSSHVMDGIESGEVERRDIKHAILNARLVETMRDEMKVAVDGNKYVLRGRARSGLPLETVGKIIQGVDEHEYFLISVYVSK